MGCFHSLVVNVDDDEEGKCEEDVNVLEDRLSDLFVSVDVGISEQKVSAEEGQCWDDPHHQVTNGRKAEGHEGGHATERTEENNKLGDTNGATSPRSLSNGLSGTISSEVSKI